MRRPRFRKKPVQLSMLVQRMISSRILALNLPLKSFLSQENALIKL